MIQQGNIKDTSELFLLESSVFSQDDYPLSRGSFYYHLKNNKLFVFKQEGKIVGYILWLKRKNSFRLYSLCVANEYRSQGIAQKLLVYSFQTLNTNKFTLEVKISNQKAIDLYVKNGFKIKKVLKEFYPKKVDGYLMVRGLSTSNK